MGEKVCVGCVKNIQILDLQVYRLFWKIGHMDIRSKNYPGISGVSEIRVDFLTYFSKKGGIYAQFLKIGSQKLDYLIVLRYNFGCPRN
jgi:hypothetical protein